MIKGVIIHYIDIGGAIPGCESGKLFCAPLMRFFLTESAILFRRASEASVERILSQVARGQVENRKLPVAVIAACCVLIAATLVLPHINVFDLPPLYAKGDD